MIKTVSGMLLALSIVSTAYAAEDVVSALRGTIKKIDTTTMTIVVITADGTDLSLRFLDSTAVHGAKASSNAGKVAWHGLTEGSEVVAHYTKRGTEDTAVEVDKVGRDGLKMTKGTIKDFDRGTRKLVVETGNGAESIFRLTDHAAKDGGKDMTEGAEQGTRVTVYYSEDAGKKVAHYFEKS